MLLPQTPLCIVYCRRLARLSQQNPGMPLHMLAKAMYDMEVRALLSRPPGAVAPVPQKLAKMTINPARILNIPKGTLAVGADADVTLIDLDREWTVDVTKFMSKSRNCPFAGWKLKGKAVFTIVGGVVKYRD